MFTGEWIYKDNIYAETALDVMLATTEKRKEAARSAFGSGSPFISSLFTALRKAVFIPEKE